ncbi:hypothetical protein SPRG_14092 [Saprolegnia parasitica CBS 223.65]|uniref:F-box domain-containing protein n=1 Tax=Saprolegnia parasitica (strain CBS 223.65) TaxID=695850 RepID=A0A067C2T5_SAPPC|nr:hypothetical protein SPRG_14092 [Saprolegnia parasitica CBS 223.65]KDO20861.1 hypothetical protein SPRG_14092 [Saprolegnia parasitica CBS 223.65]|eukprot:XP_012208439.1 hypothetical protein SPRG_14092 [Saprolegnia parasitica CBS 223.65]
MLERLDSGPLLTVASFVPEPAQVAALLHACPTLSLGLVCLRELVTLLPPHDVWPDLCLRKSELPTSVLAPLVRGSIGLYRSVKVYDLGLTAMVAAAALPSTRILVYDTEAPSNYHLVALQTFATHLTSSYLNLQSFSPTKVVAAAAALRQCHHLTHLKLAWTSPANAVPVLEALPKLTHFTLGYTHLLHQPMRLTAADEVQLATWVTTRSARELEIAGVAPLSGVFPKALQHAQSLEALLITSAPEMCAILLNGAPMPRGLRRLELHCTGLKAADMPNLSLALDGAPQLETLRLSNNYLGVMGMRLLAPRLERLGSLTHLMLASTFLMDEGCHWVAASLRHMPRLRGLPSTLTHLMLKLNRLGDDGLDALVRAGIHTLTQLDVSNTLVTTAGAQKIVCALPGSRLRVNLSRVDMTIADVALCQRQAGAIGVAGRVTLAPKDVR